MNDFRCSRLVYIVFLVTVCLALTMRATLKTANAQTIQPELLVGTWTGSITTAYDGVKNETPISVNFEDGYTVTLTMLVPRSATYTVENNTIRILFRASENEPLTLENVRLNQDSMVADGHFPSDHSSISNRVTLLRTGDNRRVGAPTPHALCGKNDLRPNVQILFDKYQIRCPINVLENSRWYNSYFFEAFLRDLIKEVLAMSPVPLSSEELSFRKSTYGGMRELRDYLRKYPNGQFVNVARAMLRESEPAGFYSRSNGILIAVYDEQSVGIIQNFITPILENPHHITFELLRDPQHPLLYTFNVSELKPSFRENRFTVDLDKIWAEIINAAAPMGINLDAKTITQKENTRTISQTVPRRISEPGGYIYFEYVTVTMESSRRNNLMVDLKSKIIKRKGYSSLTHSIDCNLNDRGSTICSEQPYMKAIIRALTGRD